MPSGWRAAPPGSAARRELVPVCRLDIPAPEMPAEPDPCARSKMMSVSGRAAPGGSTTAGRSCTSDWASALISKPILSASRSKQEATGSTMSAISGCRVHEQIGVDVEVQRGERPPPPRRVGKREQQVGAEARPARAPGRVCPPAPRGRNPARRRCSTSPARADGPRARRPAPCAAPAGKSSPVTAALGTAGNSTLPPRRSKDSGQRVEQRHGARGLRGVGVVLVPAPGVVGDRPACQMSRAAASSCSGATQQVSATSSGVWRSASS